MFVRNHWKRGPWLLLAMGLATGCAQTQEVRKDVRLADKAPMLKVIPNGLLARMLELASSAEDCKSKDTGPIVCKIEMATIRYPDAPGGKVYCVAIAPKVNVETDASGGIFNHRRIVWYLSAANLKDENGVDRQLAFHNDAGVVLTVNQHTQLDHWGKLGDGSSGPVLQTFFHTRTVRNVKNASATYLPVILWGPPDTAELCAAVDPKIVNV